MRCPELCEAYIYGRYSLCHNGEDSELNGKGSSRMDITELTGEATSYEKKREVERRKVRTWLKSVSAFANTSGGTLIFGIDNDGQVVGLKNIKSDSEFISKKIKERISPFPEADMKLHKAADRKELLSLYVPRGSEPLGKIIPWPIFSPS